MKIRRLPLSLAIAAILICSPWAGKAQQGGIAGCGAGLPSGLGGLGGFGVPSGCGSGVPSALAGLILLSSSTIASTATNPAVIGTLSVTGGTGSYTYSFTSNPGGLFAISGSNLQVALALATPVNSAFSTATTGGTLAAGTYFYRVSATDAAGQTLASTETSQVTTGTTSTVTVNWGAVSGATGYKVYGRTTGAELLMATLGAVTTFVDTGSVTPSGALPSSNTTLLAVGADPITIQANNGAGSIITQPFTITVTGTGGPMDFSVAGNIAATAAVW